MARQYDVNGNHVFTWCGQCRELARADDGFVLVMQQEGADFLALAGAILDRRLASAHRVMGRVRRPVLGHGKDGAVLRADLDLWMAAAGLRGTLLDGGGDDITLAGMADSMMVQTSSGRGRVCEPDDRVLR